MTKNELKQKYRNEKIAVVTNKELEQLNLQEGFNKYSKDVFKYILTNSFFILRYNAEQNKKFKQPLAYLVFRHKDKFFMTQRLKQSGESRLVGNYSIGQGGHINPVDNMKPGNIILNSVIREMHEELLIEPNAKLNSKIVGFINDNSNDVSEDHLAVVVLIDISNPKIQVKEKDKLKGEFVDKEFLKENYDKLESWSQIVYNKIIL